MSSTKVISVSLPPKQVAEIEKAVENGDFTTRSGVVSAALRMWLEAQGNAARKTPGLPTPGASKDGVSDR